MEVDLDEQPDIVTCLKFRRQLLNDEKELFATGESDGIVTVYSQSPSDSQSAVTYESKDHFFPVNDIQFADTMPWMATCSNDTLLNMHDLNKCQLVRSFSGHSSFITKCKFNSYQNLLLSVGAEGFLYVFDIRQNKTVWRLHAHPEPCTGLDISFDSSLICTSAYDGYVRLWDMHRQSCVKTLAAETGGNCAVSVLQMIGPNLLMGNTNSQLGIYDLQGRLKKTY